MSSAVLHFNPDEHPGARHATHLDFETGREWSYYRVPDSVFVTTGDMELFIANVGVSKELLESPASDSLHEDMISEALLDTLRSQLRRAISGRVRELREQDVVDQLDPEDER